MAKMNGLPIGQGAGGIGAPQTMAPPWPGAAVAAPSVTNLPWQNQMPVMGLHGPLQAPADAEARRQALEQQAARSAQIANGPVPQPFRGGPMTPAIGNPPAVGAGFQGPMAPPSYGPGVAVPDVMLPPMRQDPRLGADRLAQLIAAPPPVAPPIGNPRAPDVANRPDVAQVPMGWPGEPTRNGIVGPRSASGMTPVPNLAYIPPPSGPMAPAVANRPDVALGRPMARPVDPTINVLVGPGYRPDLDSITKFAPRLPTPMAPAIANLPFPQPPAPTRAGVVPAQLPSALPGPQIANPPQVMAGPTGGQPMDLMTLMGNPNNAQLLDLLRQRGLPAPTGPALGRGGATPADWTPQNPKYWSY